MKHIHTFESFLNETKSVNEKKAYVELDTFDFDDADFQKFLKKNNIKAKQVASGGPSGDMPIYVYTASDKDTLKKMLDQFWLTDAGSREDKEEWYRLIESSLNEEAITKAIRPSLEGEVKVAVQNLEKELASAGVNLNKYADVLADCIIDIIDAAKAEERAEYKD